jgi:hypothetical protein
VAVIASEVWEAALAAYKRGDSLVKIHDDIGIASSTLYRHIALKGETSNRRHAKRRQHKCLWCQTAIGWRRRYCCDDHKRLARENMRDAENALKLRRGDAKICKGCGKPIWPHQNKSHHQNKLFHDLKCRRAYEAKIKEERLAFLRANSQDMARTVACFHLNSTDRTARNLMAIVRREKRAA